MPSPVLILSPNDWLLGRASLLPTYQEPWYKHALMRREMPAIELGDLLPDGVNAVDVGNLRVTAQATPSAPWQDHTPEFTGGPGTPDPNLPAPTIDNDTVVVWFRRVVAPGEQNLSTYVVMVNVVASDGQIITIIIPMFVDQTARVIA